MYRKKWVLLLVVAAILLTAAGCGGKKQQLSGPQAMQLLREQLSFATELTQEDGSIYFPSLPDGSSVIRFSGSGYYADELVLISLNSKDDLPAARQAIDNHLKELKNQFLNYFPEEVGKIDNAVIYETDQEILLCITDDYINADSLLTQGLPAADSTHSEPAAETQLTAPETKPTAPETKPTATETEPTKPETETTEPETEATEPETEATEPETEATEPETEATEPETEATEPETEATEPETEATEPETEATEPETEATEPETEATEPETEATEPETEPTVPEISESGYPILRSKEGVYHDYGNNIIRVDNSAFELYRPSSSAAETYAGLINKAADELHGQTDVYALAIPTAVGVILPDDIAQILPSFVDQGQAIENIYAQMNEHVIPVRCFQNMMAHRNEYLYFRTDYHWNGRGAYYAYESFCQTKGIAPISLSERTKEEFGGFLGLLYTRFSGEDPALKKTPDTVEAFWPKSDSATMNFTDVNGDVYDWNIITDVSEWNSESKYSTFAGSDNPLATFTNPEINDDSVCIVVKESFGNALLPYLVDHYHTIYEIDYRYWQGNIVEFTKQMEADDLIFANNLTMIGADLLVGYLAEIF